ncbi:MAG: prepilin-type N-terminal cleavage/methylation domain-containing protein [Burkholderiales bacterium]|nr:prepilin-type N-terminal cleavage/methylation domain-containing protein [Burkholderiales bacterium]MDE2075679.1 prepilin-type N-terminal cleavage/methylation domain-containing protein [Burkholderiales bacterium]MDE2432120.1 prepilin-type N-terminal cleavage/methylation domain-containing protein [Burkholderiales bacterium]
MMRSRGFTLIEVLVSLLILAVMSAAAWKGMDAITRARDIADGKLKQTLRLQSVMTQWEDDLAAVVDTMVVPAWQFDGANVRMTRRTGAGPQMVVWSLRNGQWLRWASPASTTVGELQQYWMRSFQLQGKEHGTLVALNGLDQWQVYCHRNGNWSNCQSSNDVTQVSVPASGSGSAAPTRTREVLPQAIRLVLVLQPESGFSGQVTRDVIMPPQPNQGG